jgi:WD40 repeat protein
VSAVAIAPDGAWLATAGMDGTARIWDAATGRPRATLTGHNSRVTAVAIAPDGAWLATAGMDGTVRTWDAASGAISALMRADSPLKDCTWSPSGQRIAMAGSAGIYLFAFNS